MTQTPLIPPEFSPTIIDAWLASTDRATAVLASFKRVVLTWQQAGEEIDNSGLWYELQKMDDSGLSSFAIKVLADVTIVMSIPPNRLPPARVGGPE